MEATALFKFDASQADELSFNQGDTLKIRNKQDENWYQAELRGARGYVPKTYIKMGLHDWYKGAMSRQESEAFLLGKTSSSKKSHDGAFIIRDCQTERDQFSLSVKHGDGLQHFKILFNSQNGTYYLWPDKTFPSINKLIEYHRTVSVSREPNSRIFLRNDIDEEEEEDEYVALYDFSPESPEELPLCKGDKIRIVEKTDPNWWTGEVKGHKGKCSRGFLPSNYIKKVKG